MGAEQDSSGRNEGQGLEPISSPIPQQAANPDAPMLPVIFDQDGVESSLIEPGMMDMETRELMAQLSPRQQDRIQRYTHLVDTVALYQTRLNRGKKYHYFITDENKEKVLNDKGEPQVIVITQEVLDSWRGIARSMEESFRENPVMTRIAHRKSPTLRIVEDERDEMAKRQIERMWEVGSDEDI